SSRRRHTRFSRDWSSDVCSSDLLQEQGEIPLDVVARAVRLHHNTVREHLDRLIEAGFVESRPERRGTRGRPRILYRPADAPGHKSLDENFREHFMQVLVAGYGRSEERRVGEECRSWGA